MTPKIVDINERLVAGLRINTSLSENMTVKLWRSFKQRTLAVQEIRSRRFYSVQKFPDDVTFQTFLPTTRFEKWAAVPREDFDALPEGFEELTIPEGKYAVFIHRGSVDTFPETTRYIFREWLPGSGFEPDARVHFEIFGDDYRPDDPMASEEVWIPIC